MRQHSKVQKLKTKQTTPFLRSLTASVPQILDAGAIITFTVEEHKRERERERERGREQMACFANLPMISSPNPNPNPNLKASASLSQSSISTKLHFSSQFSSLSPSPLSLRCNQTLILRRFGGRAPSVSPTLVVCVAVFHFVNFDLSRFLPFSAFVSTLGKFGENF